MVQLRMFACDPAFTACPPRSVGCRRRPGANEDGHHARHCLPLPKVARLSSSCSSFFFFCAAVLIAQSTSHRLVGAIRDGGERAPGVASCVVDSYSLHVGTLRRAGVLWEDVHYVHIELAFSDQIYVDSGVTDGSPSRGFGDNDGNAGKRVHFPDMSGVFEVSVEKSAEGRNYGQGHGAVRDAGKRRGTVLDAVYKIPLGYVSMWGAGGRTAEGTNKSTSTTSTNERLGHHFDPIPMRARLLLPHDAGDSLPGLISMMQVFNVDISSMRTGMADVDGVSTLALALLIPGAAAPASGSSEPRPPSWLRRVKVRYVPAIERSTGSRLVDNLGKEVSMSESYIRAAGLVSPKADGIVRPCTLRNTRVATVFRDPLIVGQRGDKEWEQAVETAFINESAKSGINGSTNNLTQWHQFVGEMPVTMLDEGVRATLKARIDSAVQLLPLALKPIMATVLKPVIKATSDFAQPVLQGTLIAEISKTVATEVPPDVIVMVGSALKANLSNILTDTLTVSISKSLTKSLVRSVGPKIVEEVDPSLSPSLHTILHKVLERKLPDQLRASIPDTLDRVLTITLTHALTRSLTHSVVPTLTHTLTHHRKSNSDCNACYAAQEELEREADGGSTSASAGTGGNADSIRRRRMEASCSLCHFSPITVYYQLYHATYVADWYSNYYSDYYTQALQMVDAAMFPELNGYSSQAASGGSATNSGL